MTNQNLGVMQQAYIKRLSKMITGKGKECAETLGDILDNLDVLAIEIPNFDEKKLLLPLEIKRMIAFVISPEYRMEYETKRDGDFLTVIASLYWKQEDIHPAGTGFMRANIKTCFSGFSLNTGEERECKFEATVRGSAATRAFYDAGIGLGFGDEIPDPEQMEKDMAENDPGQMPDPQAAKQPERKPRKKKEEILSVGTSKDALSSPISQAPTAPSSDVDACKDIAAESGTSDNKISETSEIPLEDAISAIADMGMSAGHTLGEILDKQPNNLIWLWNSGSKLKPQLEVVIRSDEELYKKFREKCLA